ncbi:MAG TPA: ABC transporter ATP-binding protein [Candidatus Avacidaminococcus intestinavium]|uniref:ABC transporter ATP-binding protein n=1 Tax=Candidatus Avacidaminococcus intestinavium TaxID=2840684 RepID=A0A9D1SM27_9FIRM|nr:ABC transporter ATP-binding protein [Candidatus Avacidaminococcus intestinavium]
MEVKLQAERLVFGYKDKIILENISLDFLKPEIVSIIGPNGSGKSTLLKTLCKLLTPTQGTVYLNGKDIQAYQPKALAKTISVLPQSPRAPGDMTIRDLATFGRMPYQSFLAELSSEDGKAVDDALAFTELTHMQFRRLDTLSGGERQRAWLAMALAQNPRVLLLDEPTTYLDIHHQLELMELIGHLHRERQLTIIMVLHDLNHAARYSQRLVAVKGGKIIADGTVETVFTETVLERLYNVKAVVTTLKQGAKSYPLCFPYTTTEHF